MKNKAVVIGTNYYIALSAIRCLGVHGIEVVAMDYSQEGTYAAKSKYLSERLIAPHCKEDPKGFVEFLINYGKKQDCPPLLVPCHDAHVEVIDNHLEELRKYYLIPQTEPGLWMKLVDKGSLYELALEHGVPVPETVRIDDENFFEKVESTVKYPCLVKPVDSPSFVAAFRKKLFKVYNREELEEAVRKSKDSGLEVIVQRIIPGFDDHMYTFDAYLNQDAKVTHWSTHQKYRQFPINFGASVYTGHKYVPELYEIGAKFFEDVGYKGFAEIEFKKDAETGKYYMIEVNARITNFNHLIYKLGINIPYIAYRELTGEPLEAKTFNEDQNLVFRYLYEDLFAIRDYIKTGQLSFGQVFKSLLRPKVYAIWDPKDPMPAFSYLGIIMGKVVKKIFKTKD